MEKVSHVPGHKWPKAGEKRKKDGQCRWSDSWTVYAGTRSPPSTPMIGLWCVAALAYITHWVHHEGAGGPPGGQKTSISVTHHPVKAVVGNAVHILGRVSLKGGVQNYVLGWGN